MCRDVLVLDGALSERKEDEGGQRGMSQNWDSGAERHSAGSHIHRSVISSITVHTSVVACHRLRLAEAHLID